MSLRITACLNVGDLGIRSAVHLAPSAFLASADGSLDLVHHYHQIHPHMLHTTPPGEVIFPGDHHALFWKILTRKKNMVKLVWSYLYIWNC